MIVFREIVRLRSSSQLYSYQQCFRPVSDGNCQLLRHVQGFPLLRLLWADLTSKRSSFALLFTQLPYHLPCGIPLDLSSSQCISTYMPRLENSADSPQSHHCDCFAWTSMALQTSSVRSNIYRSDTSTSGTRPPYGLYDSLCTLHLSCSSGAINRR